MIQSVWMTTRFMFTTVDDVESSSIPTCPPEQPGEPHPEKSLPPVKVFRLQLVGAALADEVSQRGGSQHVDLVPRDHGVVNGVQRLYPLFHTVETSVQDAIRLETHS